MLNILVARWMVAVLYLYSGVGKIRNLPSTAETMRRYHFPFVAIALPAAFLIEIIGGSVLASGFATRPSAIVLGVYLILATAMIPGQDLFKADAREAALMNVAKNIGLLASLILLYAQPMAN